MSAADLSLLLDQADASREAASIWIPAVLMIIGTAGIVVPVLPGLLLVLGAVALWAVLTGGAGAWGVFAACAVIYLAAVALQYLVPGRRLKAAGVSTTTLLLAVGLGIVGFVVIPVVGGPVGFVLGIYLVEQGRSRDGRAAWTRTTHALRAVLTSMGIELLGALLIAVLWVAALLLR